MKKAIIGTIIALIILGFNGLYVGKLYSEVTKHNKEYPVEYIEDHYPDAEIISSNITKSLFVDTVHDYLCYDTSKDFSFHVYFSANSDFGKIYIYDDPTNSPSDYNSYSGKEKRRELFDDCISKISYNKDHFFKYNLDNKSGIIMFVKNTNVDDFNELNRQLKEIVLLAQPDMHAIYYTLCAVPPDLYDKIEKADWSSLYRNSKYMQFVTDQAGFNNLMDAKMLTEVDYDLLYSYHSITITQDVYNNKGDKNNPNYINPKDYDNFVYTVQGSSKTTTDSCKFEIYGLVDVD